MLKLSLNAASDWAVRFFRREAGIVMPVALATFGLGMLLVSLTTPAAPSGGRVEPGPWMIALLPATLAALVGQLAISLMVLRPGASVGEALGRALRKLPRALLIVLLLAGIGMAAMLVLGLILGLLAVIAGASTLSLTALAVALLTIGMLWLAARLLFIWPMLVEKDAGAVATLRDSWRLSKGNTARLIAALLAFGLVYVIVTGAVQFVFGSIFLIIGKALAAEGAARFFAALVVAIVGAALQALWAVFVTCLYRDAVGSTNGS